MSSSQTSSTSTPSNNSQEFIVRVPKNVKKKYHVMKFNAALKIDYAKWHQVKLERENNLKEFKNEEDVPKFGAGSEYGREFREEARRKKYGIVSRRYNPDDQPWLLKIGGKNGKKFKGVREGGVTDNSSYYVFMQAQDGAYEAFPIDQWYNFTPIHTYKTLNAEEAEEEFGRRDKVMNYFSIMTRKRLKNDDEEEGEESEKQKKSGKYGLGSGELKISDMDEWVNSSEEEEQEEEKSEEDEKKAKQKQDAKGKAKTKGKGKGKGKGKKKKKGSSDEDPLEDSDDGDEEGREIDYISDESSSSAEEVGEKSKDEMKGVEDEEAIRKMENSESEEETENKENPTEVKEESGVQKPPTKDKKDKKDVGSSSESSSDTSESDDFDNDTSYQSAMFMQKSGKKSKRDLGSSSRGSTPTKHGDSKESHGKKDSSGKRGSSSKKESGGHKRHGNDITPPSSKKIKLESAASVPGTSLSSFASEGINEDAVRRYLSRKPMTTTELLQKFKSKKTGLNSEQMVMTLTQILKRLNLDKQMIKGKMYLSIK